MTTFKIAFIGNMQDKKSCEVINKYFEDKNIDDSSIEVVDITDKSIDEINEMGAFQGVLYYNEIHSIEEYSNKFKEFIKMQSNPKDVALFPLTHKAVGANEKNQEQSIIDEIYLEAFPGLTENPNKVWLSNVNTEHEITSYCNGIILPLADIYISKVNRISRTADDKLNRLVEIVVDATEQKHDYTAGHVYRVSKYTEELAKQMGLPEEKVKEVSLAAKLHDIGKIVVTDSILAKNSNLNFDERNEMGEHTEQGVAILEAIVDRDSKLSKLITPDIIQAVGYHHKDWNGMHGKKEGTPDSIRGDDIGEYGLIIAVADCIDAMTSQRAYNNPKHILDTLRDLYSNRGIQFKPEIAEAAIIMLGKEFSTLGIDPLKIVEENPSGKNEELDRELKSFLEQHKQEFEVNQTPEFGAYGKLGFRIDDNGYFEFNGKSAPVRDTQIRFNDEFGFLAGKYARDNNISYKEVIENPEIVSQIKAKVSGKFEAQDLEGRNVIGRANLTKVLENNSEINVEDFQVDESMADQVFSASKDDFCYNIDNYKVTILSVVELYRSNFMKKEEKGVEK